MRVPENTLMFSFPVPHQRLDVLNLNTNYAVECIALSAAVICISSTLLTGITRVIVVLELCRQERFDAIVQSMAPLSLHKIPV